MDWSSSMVSSILSGLLLLAPWCPSLLPDFLKRLLPVSAFAPMLLATTADTVVSRDESFSLSSLFSEASFNICFSNSAFLASSSEYLFL